MRRTEELRERESGEAPEDSWKRRWLAKVMKKTSKNGASAMKIITQPALQANDIQARVRILILAKWNILHEIVSPLLRLFYRTA